MPKKTVNGTDVAHVAQQQQDSNKAERIKRDFYRTLWENAVSLQSVWLRRGDEYRYKTGVDDERRSAANDSGI